jgi:uncharacterized protein
MSDINENELGQPEETPPRDDDAMKSTIFDGVRIDAAKYGFGVYATRTFDAGEMFAHVEGKIIDDPHYSSDYCIDLGEPFSLVPGAPFKYLNHSCEPNCELVHMFDHDDIDKGIWVETLCNIEPGEQLTIDYAWPADSAIRCLCGAEECRGWIVHPEEIHEVEQQQKQQ